MNSHEAPYRAPSEYSFLCLRFMYVRQYSALKYKQFLFILWSGIKIFIIRIKQHAKLCDCCALTVEL